MPGPIQMPDGVEAHVRPQWFKDGDAFTIEVTGATHLANQTVNAVLFELSAIETQWILQAPMELDKHGNGTSSQPDGLNLGHEASVYVSSLIEVKDGELPQEHQFPMVRYSIANSGTPISSLDDVIGAHLRIVAEQESTYVVSLGEPAGQGALEHRVLSVVQGLYMTTLLKLPGIRILPVEARPTAAEEREIINAVLADMRWPSRITERDWHGLSQARTPIMLIVCDRIWARTYEEAGELARDVRDRVIALMAINRRATGRPVCLVIEQRQPNNAVVSKWASEQPSYTGNLAGGFISGESQSRLLKQYRGIEADPLVKLCCDLYGEALNDRSIDAQFLRFWSILEFLSGARLLSNHVVTLRNGSPWPNTSANTTKTAKPRVYRYVATFLDRGNIDEASVLAPATDLYEAVCVWYARRNATGHYGRFVVGDAIQMTQNWYPQAQSSLTSSQPGRTWIRALQDVVSLCIENELLSASPLGP